MFYELGLFCVYEYISCLVISAAWVGKLTIETLTIGNTGTNIFLTDMDQCSLIPEVSTISAESL